LTLRDLVDFYVSYSAGESGQSFCSQGNSENGLTELHLLSSSALWECQLQMLVNWPINDDSSGWNPRTGCWESLGSQTER